MDRHAESRDAKRRKARQGMRTRGKSVFLILEQIRKRAQGQRTDPATPGRRCDHGRLLTDYCARCSL